MSYLPTKQADLLILVNNNSKPEKNLQNFDSKLIEKNIKDQIEDSNNNQNAALRLLSSAISVVNVEEYRQKEVILPLAINIQRFQNPYYNEKPELKTTIEQEVEKIKNQKDLETTKLQNWSNINFKTIIQKMKKKIGIIDSFNSTAAGRRDITEISKYCASIPIQKYQFNNLPYNSSSCSQLQKKLFTTTYSKSSSSSSASTSIDKRNARERTRVHTVNQTFHLLKQQLPALRANTKRVSKLKILRAAVKYIYLLDSSLKDTKILKNINDIEGRHKQKENVKKLEKKIDNSKKYFSNEVTFYYLKKTEKFF